MRQVNIYTTTISLVYGVPREGVRWLVLRYPARSLKTWQEGVFFGLIYTTATSAIQLYELVEYELLTAANILGTMPFGATTSKLQTIQSLSELPPAKIFKFLNESLQWIEVVPHIMRWNIGAMGLNIGTAVAILYSVRARKAWPFFAALACYVISYSLLLRSANFFDYENMMRLINLSDALTNIVTSPSYRGRSLLLLLYNPIPLFIQALPGLALTLLIRKIMIRETG